MVYDPDHHQRRSIRLPGHDYAGAGAYFITIVAYGRACLFGDIVNGEMRLNRFGQAVTDAWAWLGAQYSYVDVDAYVVMPNHIHGVLFLREGHSGRSAPGRGGSRTAPTGGALRKPLGRLIGAFKTVSAKTINQSRGTPGAPVWQRNYYEHIVRDEAALDRIRAYIADNPAHWSQDSENPSVGRGGS